MNKATIGIITFIAAFLLGAWYVASRTMNYPEAPATDADDIVVTYQCAENKSIWATFNARTNMVNLSLSDGSSISLPHATSASGARYATADDSYVFWNKGDSAFIEKNGDITYNDCVSK